MTIGVGFRCVDGIVIGSDTQLTFEGSHKYYDRKIHEFRTPFWSAVFTYSGLADLMDVFWTKFILYMDDPTHAHPGTGLELMNSVETVLRHMAPKGLDMIAALVIPNKNSLLIKTSAKNVACVSDCDYDYTGVGESSLLRYLGNLLCHPQAPAYQYTCSQARLLTVYLIHCAKKWVDGCGGTTSLRIIHPSGRWDTEEGCTDLEQAAKEIENRIGVAASLSFDLRTTPSVLEQNWQSVAEEIKKKIPPLCG